MALVRVAHRPAKRVDQETRRRLPHYGDWQPRAWGVSGTGAPDDDPARGPSIFELPVNPLAQGLTGKVEMDLSAVVVDFEPWEGRHWTPRSVRGGTVTFRKDMISPVRRSPTGVPFTVVQAVELQAVPAPGEQLPSAPAEPEAPAAGDLPPSLRDAPPEGRDHRAIAAELHHDHPLRTTRFSLSLFAERDAEIETGDERTRVGGAVAWKPWWGAHGDGAVGGGGTVAVQGSVGGNPHVKTIVEGAVAALSVLAWAASAGVANVWGDPAPQDLWEIATNGRWIRGHRDQIDTSRTWMGRMDFQRAVRFFRVSGFADWATVKGTEGAENADCCAIGIGLVLMNGLLRLDLAQGLDCGREGPSQAGWRLHPRGFAPAPFERRCIRVGPLRPSGHTVTYGLPALIYGLPALGEEDARVESCHHRPCRRPVVTALGSG